MKNLVIFLMCSLSCAPTTTVERLNADYIIVQGVLTSPPLFEDGGNRLVLFIQQKAMEKPVVCIAANNENERLLLTISERITKSTDPDHPIILYGKQITEAWNEYATGVDLEVYAIGYYSDLAQKYQIVYSNFGSRASDAFKGISWSKFLKKVGEGAVDLAL